MAKTKTPTYARRIQALASKLAELRGRGSPRRFLPPVGDSQVAELEEQVGGPLPDEVRAFYLEVAGGERRGDVPAILDFDQARVVTPLALGEPFPFSDADAAALIEANRLRGKGEPAVARSGPMHGALPLMDHGDAMDAVVLHGEQRGKVWQRWDAGWTPLCVVKKNRPQQLEFLAWVEAEIADALKTAPPAITPHTSNARLIHLGLTEVPPALRDASSLSSLHLTGNGIVELPSWIGEMAQLRELRIGNNPLGALPESVEALVRLETLDVSRTKLSSLPKGLGKLRALRQLFATACALTSLPVELGDLGELRLLHLAQNALSQLPESIGQLTALTELDLAKNSLTELPETIGRLENLRVLQIANNPLRALPPALERLPIEALDLEGMPDLQWDEAIAVVSRMQSLKTLRIRQPLPALPPAVAQLTGLRTLRLVGLGLTAVPDAVMALTALETLSLDQNQLSTLPDAIGAMPALRTVVLFSNPVAPDELLRLRTRFPHLLIEHF